MKPLLKIDELNVIYQNAKEKVKGIKGLSLSLNKGETLGIIGESGSGKTSLALAVMGLIPQGSQVNGIIEFEGRDLRSLNDRERRSYRWKKIAMVFQNSIDTLNPVLTVGEQVGEALVEHLNLSRRETQDKVGELLNRVGLDQSIIGVYPHQLSGGMRQRVLVAMALGCHPDLLMVDEPTTALDPTAKREMAELLITLQEEMGFAMMVISHELPLIAQLTSRVMVLYSGHVMEEGLTRDVLFHPLHPYTRGLIQSSPDFNPYQDLWGIPQEEEKKTRGCPFLPRCCQCGMECDEKAPALVEISPYRRVACHQGGIITLLEGRKLSKSYQRQRGEIKACRNCNIKIRGGEVIALIGESGSGKTTLASLLAGYIPSDEGVIFFKGRKIEGTENCRIKGGIQMVFQDPFTAVNEYFTVEQSVMEPLIIGKEGRPEERKDLVMKALKDVGLPTTEAFLMRRCHALSGGQRQRVALARSLMMEPRLLIADEISSMLDPSTQANILRLLKGLQNQKGFAMLYITHDLGVARKIADRVWVMYQGEIVDEGHPIEIFSNPNKGYTRELVGNWHENIQQNIVGIF